MPVQPAVPLSVAIYLRVSTEEQARAGYSLPEQRAECLSKARQLAREHESSVGQPVDLQIAEFVDDFGGDVAERPALEAVRDYVRQRRPAWLVCMDPDRFSRSLKLQLIVADDLEAHGTRLVFVQQEYDPGDIMSRAFFQFRGLMSELEKAKILERTSRGRRGKIRAGKRPNGAAPFGYIHRKESDDLAVCEPEAVWVRSIFNWVAQERMSVHQVTRRLNDLGVPCKRGGARWHRSVVRDLLGNPAYHGHMRCNRKDFRGLAAIRRLPPDRRKPLSARLRPPSEWATVPVPAIVSRDLWEQAQAALRPASRRGGRRDTGLLSMLVRCGACGGSMAYARHASGRRYLRCQSRYAGNRRCTSPHQRAERIEQQVWTQLTAWLTEPELVEAYLTQQPALPEPGLEAEVRALRELLEAEVRLQAVTLRRQAEAKVDEEAADRVLAESNRRLAQLKSAIADTEAQLASLAQSEPLSPLLGPVAVEAEAIRHQLAGLSPEHRRHLVLLTVGAVTVHAEGRVEIQLSDR